MFPTFLMASELSQILVTYHQNCSALCGVFEGLFENLRFQRLLAEEPMKFANLILQSPIIRSRHDLFPAAGRGQAALRHQPTPGEQLVWGDAMPTSHQAYRHTRLEGLFDHANLLRSRPAPTTEPT